MTIRLKDISKSYGDKKVLENLSVEFDQGNMIYVILGESGAGKTTLFNLLYGIDQQYNGMYYLNDDLATNYSNEQWDCVRNKQIGIVYQDYKLLEELSVYDNLYYSCFLNENEKLVRVDEVIDLMNLNDIRKQKVRNISGGQKQRLAIGRGVLNSPSVLLLDEPTGNLDDENTFNIMNYIQKIKKTCIIIIITHDYRVTDYSDIIYELKEKKLNLKEYKSQKLIKSVNPNYQKKELIKSVKVCSYFIQSLKARLKELILSNIPICIIFCVFICIFSIVTLQYKSQMDTLFNGMSKRAIYISSSNFNDNYLDKNENLGVVKSDDGYRINFSEKDLENVRKINGIKSARLYNSANISLYDNEHNKLNIVLEKESFPKILKNAPSYSTAPSSINFNFNSMNIPYEYASDFNQVNKIYGEFPKENTDEIMIPDFYAYNYANSIEDCIGNTISLSVYTQKSKFIEKKYKIVGIYSTDYSNSIQADYPIYVNYMEYDFLDLFLTEEQYQDMKKSDYENNKAVKAYQNPLYRSYKSYKNAIGTNLGDLIVLLESSDNIADIQAQLNDLFPNLKIISQYEFKYGETASAFKELQLYIYVGIALLTFIFGLVIILLNKNYIKMRNKELAILYSLGYSRKNIASIILLEYTLTMTLDLSFAYLILYLLKITRFKANELYMLFNQIFKVSMIIQVIIFIFFMIMLSVLFSLYGINKKKLRLYLERNM